jgi:hypothetical protein
MTSVELGVSERYDHSLLLGVITFFQIDLTEMAMGWE